MRWDKDVMLFQSGDRFDTVGENQCPVNVDITQNAYDSVIRWMNGTCFPFLGDAVAKASMEGVRVAVNRQVCRS